MVPGARRIRDTSLSPLPPNDISRTEQEYLWVKRIQTGDEAAFRKVYEAYFELLCDFVEDQIGTVPEAEDLVQTIFVRIWRNRDRWQVRHTLRGYLFTAARYEAIKYRRKRATHSVVDQSVDYELLTTILAGERSDLTYREGELTEAVRSAVNALSEKRRLIFILSRWYGLTYTEIANALQISVKTVENQMGQSLKFLRRRLTPILSVQE